MSALTQLSQYTQIVADTGDLEAIARLQPMDATTNPSLVLKVMRSGQQGPVLAQARALSASSHSPLHEALLVCIGAQIQALIPGYISTEADPCYSFDTQATVNQARRMVGLYQQLGADAKRVLIKIAATWAGIEAARILEAEGIKTNITLLFNLTQARAAAQAGAFLISPFVGRILDWYKAQQPEQDFSGNADPGVASVRQIYTHFKTHNYPTLVMGASFRHTQQVLALAGCDKLTISPALLDELAVLDQDVVRALNPDQLAKASSPDPALSQAEFEWALSQDPMAHFKLAEGIRLFQTDLVALQKLLADA